MTIRRTANAQSELVEPGNGFDGGGVSEDAVRRLSALKQEPEWLLQRRLQFLAGFAARAVPSWGPDLSDLDFDQSRFLRPPDPGDAANPPDLESSDAELDDSESEVVYHRNRRELARLGVIFCDMETAVREHPELVASHLGSVVGVGDNKFADLNGSVWSGGSFIHVPPGVEVDHPLQAYSRFDTRRMGRFERTLIVAEEGSKVHYLEGCSAPIYTPDPLHAGVVEVVVKAGAEVGFTTIQNWSTNVFNLVTKRATVGTEGYMEWIDGNIGGRATMTYPSTVLTGPKASGQVLSVAYAGPGQHQDTGAKMFHLAPETTSTVIAKSVTKDGGRGDHRCLVHIDGNAEGCRSIIRRDALVLDDRSEFDLHPATVTEGADMALDHEDNVGAISARQLFYLMSRGLSAEQATGTIVNGFVEPVTSRLPLEYSVEWSRLIELQMEGSIG